MRASLPAEKGESRRRILRPRASFCVRPHRLFLCAFLFRRGVLRRPHRLFLCAFLYRASFCARPHRLFLCAFLFGRGILRRPRRLFAIFGGGMANSLLRARVRIKILRAGKLRKRPCGPVCRERKARCGGDNIKSRTRAKGAAKGGVFITKQ